MLTGNNLIRTSAGRETGDCSEILLPVLVCSHEPIPMKEGHVSGDFPLRLMCRAGQATIAKTPGKGYKQLCLDL